MVFIYSPIPYQQTAMDQEHKRRVFKCSLRLFHPLKTFALFYKTPQRLAFSSKGEKLSLLSFVYQIDLLSNFK